MDELEYIKKLAGVNEFKGYTEYTLENMSQTATELKKKEKAAINIQSLPVLDFTKGYKSEEINQWVQNWKHIS